MAGLKDLLEQGPIVINLGLQEFAKAVEEQGGNAIHVDWAPRPEIEEDLKEILDRLL